MIRKASSAFVFSRAVAATTALVFTTSCTRSVPIAPSALRSSEVVLLLLDETRVELAHAYLDGGEMVRGDVRSCSGACAEVERDSGVPLRRIGNMTARVANPHETTGWIAGAVLTAATIAGIGYGVSKQASGPSRGGGGSGIALTGMSCPRMYSWNGSDWQLDSGTFGGSLFAAAQLTDHDLLDHLAPQSGKLHMRLRNELPETEHTDAVSLRVVDHPAGTRVVPTAAGKLLTFRDPEPPLAAADLRGAVALERVSRRDGLEWTSDVSNRSADRDGDARDGLALTFAKPPGATRAKLWIAARNTPWASDMLLYLLSLLGPALPAWYARTSADAEAWGAFSAFMEKEGALLVQVRAGGEWARRGVVPVAGPEIVKDQALEIPVDDVPGNRVVLRLDAPVGFWSVDSVSMSFEDDEPLTVHDLSPVTATTQAGADIAADLASIDGRYYSTVRGEEAELSFEAPPRPAHGLSRSYVLVSTGYYVPDVPPDPHADPAEFLRVTADPEAASRRALVLLNAALARQSPALGGPLVTP